jgi:NADPH2:quinone reductase
VGPSAVGIDVRDVYHNETRIYGCDSRKLTVSDLARRLEKMGPYFESGEFRPLPVTASYSLEQGPLAYQEVADHVAGRVVIQP